MKKRTLFAGVFATVALLAIPTIAQAQETRTLKERITPTERVAEIKAAREARKLDRCEAIQEKLMTRAQKVTTSTDHHAEIYSKLETRLQKVIDYATTVGYDTADLLAAQAAISEKIDAFTIAADEYAAALTEAREVTCDEDATPYGEAIVGARDALRAVREAAKAVHQAFRNDAVPAFTDFAKTLGGNTNDSTEQEND